jgi:hypothetical protein
VLYEMITGRVPFYGEGYGEVLVQHLTQAPPPPSTIRGLIPPHVEQVILKALEKRPELRFPTMDEMSKALMDPVGYVEARGGIANFLRTEITPTNEPVAPVSRLTPSPAARLTPVPGSVTTPTTLGGATGQAVGPSGGSKKGLIIGAGVAVIALGVVLMIVLGGGGGGGGGGTAPATGSVVGTDTATGSAVATGSDTASGVATGSDTASSGSGAATGSDTASSGSGAATGSDVATGSGAATGSDVGSATQGAEIKVKVESNPKGAFVTFGDELKPRGKTPLEFNVPSSDSEVEIDIELPGYTKEERKVKLSGNVDLEVALNKKKSSGGGGSSGGGHGSSRGSGRGSGGGTGGTTGDDVMDPFK